MGNGKALQKFKDKLNETGCEQGRAREIRFKQYEKDVGDISARTSLLLRWLIVVAIMLIADLGTKVIPFVFKAIMGG